MTFLYYQHISSADTKRNPPSLYFINPLSHVPIFNALRAFKYLFSTCPTQSSPYCHPLRCQPDHTLLYYQFNTPSNLIIKFSKLWPRTSSIPPAFRMLQEIIIWITEFSSHDVECTSDYVSAYPFDTIASRLNNEGKYLGNSSWNKLNP